MMNPISSIQAPRPIDPSSIGTNRASGQGFGDLFKNTFDSVQSLHKEAQSSAERFMSGEAEDIHKVAMDQQRAHLAFDYVLQVRNKVVQAYQEIMRMQV